MIVRLQGGQDAELFSYALTDMVRWGFTGLRSSIGGQVNESSMRGIPALARAARMRSEAVAGMKLCVWRGDEIAGTKVDNAWQAKLFAGPPNDVQTQFDFLETIEESQAYRGNSWIWKNTANGRVLDWWALHPDQVMMKGPGRYIVTIADGYVDPVGKGNGKYEVGNETIIHVRGHGLGGQLLAPSPVQQFREAMAGPVGRMQHEGRMWRRGVAGQVAVEFPAGVNKEQADQWRELWRANYEGTNGETTMVVGGGAQIKPIGLTPVDAEFVAMSNLTAYDAARIMGVPANLLGVPVQQKGTADLEQDLSMWLRFGLQPSLQRIEASLYADPDLFGVQARLRTNAVGSMGIYPRFMTEGFVRGDIQTEDTVAHQRVQDGRLLVDEWREANGLPPLPDGLGKIPQIVPVGGGANPNTKPPAGGQEDQD